ncbi:ribosomal RNA small subunit methyltransferase B [Candidatus Kinetoplastibacterium desouzaii TCC079E]|uniref:Ribosomal RNA small subunit methyltransferase B n=1 Tax=Candidatus Kinetoplastidibacterium desouzai TCC079E TaxID=1208919 RepID=M1LSV9_9PROT|nr:16S rRNA (cytosine(967)-C(5))-methyltransferase RsmB [Candidatus Kinetoplastibacterium desouzaii]AGF47191.1 ribosomal RNA small subunit methyltransferase B [Candidatus Kinetoplastibacterium desouzaii TCC079E]
MKFHFKKNTLAAHMYISSCAIEEVLKGYSLTLYLDNMDYEFRSAVQDLSFHAMRYLGWADCVGKYLLRNYPNKLFESLLLLSLTLLKFSSEKEFTNNIPIYKEFTIVNESCNVANTIPILRPYKGLLNAILRRFLREKDNINSYFRKDLKAVWNYQEWWIDKVQKCYPLQWQSILSCANTQSPLILRVNKRNINREKVLEEFASSNIEAKSFGESGILLYKSRSIKDMPGFDEGWWSVQDSGAQLAIPLLQIQDGMRVLDACAAPGGKTSHLLELADVKLLALDSNKIRLNRLQANLERLKLNSSNTRFLVADAGSLNQWWDGVMFNVVIADVPCTASGIVRKHPDIRWLRKYSDIQKSVLLQKRILESLWKTVVSGGLLLYVTCSIFPEECIFQALSFLERHQDAIFLDSHNQILPNKSQNELFVDNDGFFFALFKKK